jgi:hypothetical protein
LIIYCIFKINSIIITVNNGKLNRVWGLQKLKGNLSIKEI